METIVNVPTWDYAGLGLAHAARVPWLDRLFGAVTWLGSLAVLLPLSLLVWWRHRSKGGASFVLLALLGTSATTHLIKLIVARPRPEFFPPLIPMPEDWSFPSAHAAQVTALALGWLLRPEASPSWLETVSLFAVALIVVMSRLYLQVHFPSDVVARIMLATLWVIFLRSLPTWRRRPR